MLKKSLENLVFLDEAGAHLGMSKAYGRSAIGKRLVYACPYRRGEHYSMLSAITISKITAAIYLKGAVNGEIFLDFIETHLVPTLKEGQCVIMDNVAFHKVKGVKEAIEGAGAELIYLPPYSPDLSPIENMWSKIKSTLKTLEARCHKTFKKAMYNAFSSINKTDLLGWYQHCGYRGSVYI